jgi:hypothetical protein
MFRHPVGWRWEARLRAIARKRGTYPRRILPTGLGLAASLVCLKKSRMPRPLSEDAMNALTDALLHGRKIEAIKLYREFTGLGLKESKDEIEELELSLRAKFPDKFAARPTGGGCLGAAAVFGIGVVSAAYWLFAK